jgi:hypothetical protein
MLSAPNESGRGVRINWNSTMLSAGFGGRLGAVAYVGIRGDERYHWAYLSV